ncbi:hypothetical protein N7489_011175 [Penicillium chrysogenum]|jgi:hypothetical protein|uniref:Uncharacterized protein n=1 Tax=Penicillium chrysogenum TaxID=5076 RepID=A0ABQ8WCF0_PENCH|nr:uncharacterized protein N7489_011175 [Penicillium chrysogenum]KAJ5230467.1 hypothetical protein N7489_011175 [Penicillium chrysogenum]KAJ5264316.1 hypothetical protein N7505_008237 [Penicillium chrysogenum]KAJ5272139.1 hypothetical protein N7524_005408 [Penicillium chrysogenum]KAJ6163300.1 hypothetical protein N7497_003279 [Penicillium chrysogenum]
MLKRIRHSLRCFPRRQCDCHDDSQPSGARPNRPVEKAPRRALRQPLPKNVVKGAAPADQLRGSEYENDSEDEDSSDDYYPQAPPASGSHRGITPEMSETKLDDESPFDDPYPLSTSSSCTDTDTPPEVSDTDSNNATSSGDNFSSVATRNSHKDITSEMSDARLIESQYESFPDSGEKFMFVSTSAPGEYNADEEVYNGADEDSLGLNLEDVEMHDVSVGPKEPEYSRGSGSTNSSDRRRRRSLDSQARADAVYRGLHGSSGSSKRQRLAGSSDTAGGRVITGVEPTMKDVTRYRNKGAQYQAWIDDPEEPGCRIQPATLTIEEMTDKAQPMPWTIDESYYSVEPVELEGGDVESMNIARGGPRYRYTYLRRELGPNTLEVNEYEHRVARGVLVAERIYRGDGPHWNEVARAQYLLDFNLNTLRHVVFIDIGNEETGPYIRHELYPRFGVGWLQAGEVNCMVFRHGSAEYQELLGTKLGKAVACLVLSSFPRGTMQITRIVTWCDSTTPQMRFEIEPFIAAPIALATAA